MLHIPNTIAEGFIEGGETSSTFRRYARQILNVEYLFSVEDKGEPEMQEAKVLFSKKDSTDIRPHNDHPMVIPIRCDEWEI